MKAFFILFLFPFQLFSQDITGVWTGHIQTMGNQLPFEIVISQSNDKLTGYSLTTFTMNGSENTGIKSIKLKSKNGNVFIEDEEMIYNDYSTSPKRVKLTGNLLLAEKNSAITLTGNFKTRAMDFRTSDNLSYSGTIELVKQTATTKTKLMSMLEKLNLLNNLSFVQPTITKKEESALVSAPNEENESSIAKRKAILSAGSATKKSNGNVQLDKLNSNAARNLSLPAVNMDSLINEQIVSASQERKKEIVRSVFFTSDSLVLSLYDNGIVDGDTVSIVMNDKVILAKQGLTTRAIRYVIHVTPQLGDSLLLTMVADNLGSIPPNTGLLIVEDGDQRNEIRFTGDMQMSSAVLFRRKH
ncbi:MAG TPA: hypothetical protein VK787_05245 [Puia sp.]|jgi:hypothetical protein|nr:hypothetical protein [Puia sp.]